MTVRRSATVPRMRHFDVGVRVRLPSGNLVELFALSGGRGSAVWLCAYVHEGQLQPVGVGGRGRVVLRQDWLGRYGEQAQ